MAKRIQDGSSVRVYGPYRPKDPSKRDHLLFRVTDTATQTDERVFVDGDDFGPVLKAVGACLKKKLQQKDQQQALGGQAGAGNDGATEDASV